jgi:hypothetical protein
MTLNKAAWAIDGPTINASLARTEAYAATSGAEGVIGRNDLKVTALAVPGNGVMISAGAALVLNRYQTDINQTYTVTNVGTHTVDSSLMPGSQSSEQVYIVAIAVGDPEFSQSGHPFMLATDPPSGQETTFTYIRPIVVLETAFNARSYPAVALARLTIPASTTTIQQSMITDLRQLANPRSKLVIANVAAPGTDNSLNGGGGVAGTYERWPNIGVLSVTVPSWAVKAKIMGFVEGTKLTKATVAQLRAYVEGTSLATPITNVNELDPGTIDRRSYNFGGEIDVSSVAGTSRTFSLQGTPNADASKGGLVSDNQTSVAMQVYFEEQPI